MNDNNYVAPKLEALYSEPFLNSRHLTFQDLTNLRQVNKELRKNSRLYNKILAQGLRWIQEESRSIRLNANHPDEIRKTVLHLLFTVLTQKDYDQNFYSFYLFLGGNVPFDLIKAKAKQERHRDKWRETAINTFSCAPECINHDSTCRRCTSLTLLTSCAIFFLTIPPCMPYTPCAWSTYTGAATLGTTMGGTTIACLEKKYHIFTFCCEPYAQLKKIDEAHANQAIPAPIEMLDDEPMPIQAEIPTQRNLFSNCLRGLFFRTEAPPNERTPLVTATEEPSDRLSSRKK